MHNIKSIRERLGITQCQLAAGLGCTQGNVSFYERGQMLPPDAARKLIDYASTLGHVITFDDIYKTNAAKDLADLAQAATENVAQGV